TPRSWCRSPASPGTGRRARRRPSTVAMRSMRGTSKSPIIGRTITASSVHSALSPSRQPAVTSWTFGSSLEGVRHVLLGMPVELEVVEKLVAFAVGLLGSRYFVVVAGNEVFGDVD